MILNCITYFVQKSYKLNEICGEILKKIYRFFLPPSETLKVKMLPFLPLSENSKT